MTTYYSSSAASQSAALTDASKALTSRNEKLESHGVITLGPSPVEGDLHRIALIQSGSVIDWAGASIVSTAAAVTGSIGLETLVNGAYTYTPYATLSSAANIGRASEPQQLPAAFAPTPVEAWLSYRITGATPPPAASALIRVPRSVLAC